MLILTRRPGEAVFIGDDVKVVIIEVKGNVVRFGFDAPKNVEIHREEIYERIQALLLKDETEDSAAPEEVDQTRANDSASD